MRERLGIYGGTFDPIHYGHLRVAAAVCEAFALNRFLLVPAFVPPHKRGHEISSAYHRYAMAVLAALEGSFDRGTPVAVSTLELESPTRPYTIETLGRIQRQCPEAELFFLMGSDSFEEINLWREYQRLLTEYNIIVAARPPAEGLSVEHLSPICRERVVDLRGSKLPPPGSSSETQVYLTDYIAVDISATQIRAAVRAGESIEGLVPVAVARYIATYELYRNQD